MDLENASKEELENNDFICYSCSDSETVKHHRAMNLQEILTDSEDSDTTESVEDENDASTADDLRIVSIESAQKVDEDKIQEPDEGSDDGLQVNRVCRIRRISEEFWTATVKMKTKFTVTLID